MLLNNQWINEETKEEIKKYLGKWKWKNSSPKPRRWSKSSSKREVYSNTILTQEKKISNNLILHLKQLEKVEQIKPKISKKILMIRAEIHEIETKQPQRSMKLKAGSLKR